MYILMSVDDFVVKLSQNIWNKVVFQGTNGKFVAFFFSLVFGVYLLNNIQNILVAVVPTSYFIIWKSDFFEVYIFDICAGSYFENIYVIILCGNKVMNLTGHKYTYIAFGKGDFPWCGISADFSLGHICNLNFFVVMRDIS